MESLVWIVVGSLAAAVVLGKAVIYRAIGTRQQCRDNVAMFSGVKGVVYFIISYYYTRCGYSI